MIDDEFDIIQVRDVLEDIVKVAKYSLVPIGIVLSIYACNEYRKMKNREAFDKAEYVGTFSFEPVAKPYKQNTSPK